MFKCFHKRKTHRCNSKGWKSIYCEHTYIPLMRNFNEIEFDIECHKKNIKKLNDELDLILFFIGKN